MSLTRTLSLSEGKDNAWFELPMFSGEDSRGSYHAPSIADQFCKTHFFKLFL